MNTDILYPELREYIFRFCGNYFWRNQKLNIPLPVEVLNATGANIIVYKYLLQGGRLSDDTRIIALTDDGYDYYKQRISELIFREHKHELVLNLCPKCSKIARTPSAKQCRFCFHSWHPNKAESAEKRTEP